MSAQRLVLCVDTPGDVGFLVVLDQHLRPLCCAHRDVERLTRIDLEELLAELKTA